MKKSARRRMRTLGLEVFGLLLLFSASDAGRAEVAAFVKGGGKK